jgi:hypothetical protein
MSFIQGFGNDEGTVTEASRSYGTVTAGSTLILAIRIGAVGVFSSLSDNQGNQYTLIKSVLDAEANTTEYRVYHCLNAAGGSTTVTVTLSSGASVRWIGAEYGRIRTGPNVLDTSGVGTQTGAPPVNVTTGNIVTSAPVETLIGVSMWPNTGAFSSGTNYTLRNSVNKVALEDRDVTSAGTYNASGSVDSTQSDPIYLWVLAYSGVHRPNAPMLMYFHD